MPACLLCICKVWPVATQLSFTSIYRPKRCPSLTSQAGLLMPETALQKQYPPRFHVGTNGKFSGFLDNLAMAHLILDLIESSATWGVSDRIEAQDLTGNVDAFVFAALTD